MEEKELTVQDVFESMNEEQKEFCAFLVGITAEEAGVNVDDLEHSDDGMSEGELMHYGVLGMKWGIRRAQKKGTNYTYKSRQQKRTEKKLDKAIKKGKSADKIASIKRQLAVYNQRDKNRENYTRSVTAGKHILNTLFRGPWGAQSYNSLRSAGYAHRDARRVSSIFDFTGDHMSLVEAKREEMRTAEIQVRNRERK